MVDFKQQKKGIPLKSGEEIFEKNFFILKENWVVTSTLEEVEKKFQKILRSSLMYEMLTDTVEKVNQ